MTKGIPQKFGSNGNLILFPLLENGGRQSRGSYRRAETASLYKSDGVRKASAAQPLRSAAEYRAVCEYVLTHGHKDKRVRNYVLIALGCSLGLRVSDLLRLTVDMCFDSEGNVRRRIPLVEEKTHKKNDYIIVTSTGRAALEKWKAEYGLGRYEYIFFSSKTGKALCKNTAWEIVSGAARGCGLEGSYGTHTMRKTFGYQAFHAAQESGRGGEALELLQAKFNHSDQRVTMRYAGITDDKIAALAEAASLRLEGAEA